MLSKSNNFLRIVRMKTNKKGLLEKLAYFFIIVYLGIQISADIVELINAGETLSRVTWLSLLFLIPVTGWTFDKIKQYAEKGTQKIILRRRLILKTLKSP
jgi:putative effector of murein hydrolase LrgA (UPF0299 family)